MSQVVDHVIVCVPDLEDSVAGFETRHGVATVPGGRHRGHGTANRVVPLGDNYIELVAVVDPDEAADSAFGRWVTGRSKEPAAHGLAIGTDDLEGVCSRLSLEPLAMSRPDDNGVELRWRIAGLEQLVSSCLPFFIEWDIDPGRHPGRIPIEHPRGDVVLTDVVVTGDTGELEPWISEIDAVELRSGPPKVSFELVSR